MELLVEKFGNLKFVQTNQNFKKALKFLWHPMRECVNKTLGTGIISSAMSPPSLIIMSLFDVLNFNFQMCTQFPHPILIFTTS